MTNLVLLASAALLAVMVDAAPAEATLIQVTLTGNSENIHDNADVFGLGASRLLTTEDFVETFVVNTAAVNAFGPQTATAVSSNSIFGGSPPYAVGASLTINGRSFSTIGSNYSGIYTSGDYQILSNDMVTAQLDNNFYVDLTGAGLPATVSQPLGLTLTASQIGNVSFIDNDGGGNVSAAIGNLYPSQLTVAEIAAPVPEPSTWVMAIVGLGAVGAMRRLARYGWSGSASLLPG